MKKFAVPIPLLLALIAPDSVFAVQGGDHSGGGNALEYRIIESYMKPVEEIDGYRGFLGPILEDLSEKIPLFADFARDRLDEMAWYVVPARLKPVTEKYTGLPFSSDQLTVQNTRSSEVFIDQEFFAGMSDREKGRHLLHELMENMAVYGNRLPICGSYQLNAECMKAVRLSVNLLSRSRQLTAEQLSESLFRLGFRSAGKTKAQLEQEEKEAIEQARRDLEANRRAWPEYKSVLDQLFTGFDAYCATAGKFGVTHAQVQHELTWRERRLVKKALIDLSRQTLPIAFRAAVLDSNWARDWGLTTAEVTPFYSPIVSAWVKQDLETFFFQGRTIPTLRAATERDVEDLSENVVNLHADVCPKLEELRQRLYSTHQ
ncbi:MAG: hypothetical protein NDJ89_16885 [Oligoflexia bacterium]|nr:hypothetical protein [Oligoflexia bacterium]